MSLHATHKYLVSPDGTTGVWVHPLDLTTTTKYADWIDATHLDDDAFEALVRRLQDQ